MQNTKQVMERNCFFTDFLYNSKEKQKKKGNEKDGKTNKE